MDKDVRGLNDQLCSNLTTAIDAKNNNKVFHYLIEPYRTFNGVRGAIQTQEPGSCIWRQGPWKPISMPDRFELNDKKKNLHTSHSGRKYAVSLGQSLYPHT